MLSVSRSGVDLAAVVDVEGFPMCCVLGLARPVSRSVPRGYPCVELPTWCDQCSSKARILLLRQVSLRYSAVRPTGPLVGTVSHQYTACREPASFCVPIS